jgi:hypothetical protein
MRNRKEVCSPNTQISGPLMTYKSYVSFINLAHAVKLVVGGTRD